ncbi:peptidoglycan-recognition protein LB isoform X2 [Bicyclus anynana]|uniref:Peptidoglycan-recognition protein n=1 Tax=Bicyclus anynana TaxID=110368 RepID=A0A6J1P4W3_BICAN|nr:peptidoglycan-recognition protein LB isoform X2 [Bicyclus anynana]
MVFIKFVMCTNILAVAVGAPGVFKNADYNEVSSYDFPFVSREQWSARTAKEKLPLQTPVPYVVIHHSYTPAACYDGIQCRQAMRSMQNFHMDDRDWWDIGYSFAVGSDGAAYEGRGWDVIGAHALHFNNVSIGICLIGDWSDCLPPTNQLKTAQALIAAGVELGYVRADYKLVGHRQVRDTMCPGDTLYEEIQTWEHYSHFPSTVDDLPKVKEIYLILE